MDDISQALASAVQFHQAGKFPEAERLYREVLAEQPAHPTALHLLGLIALQHGRFTDAVELISRALAVEPDHADYLHHLGSAQATLQRWNEAAHNLRRAVAFNPNMADAHFSLGVVERKQGQFERAAASFERSAALDPNRAETHYNLGNTWNDLGRLDAAERCYREAILRQPGFLMALNNLGNVMRAQGRLEEAVAILGQAVAVQPNYARGHLNLGTALVDLWRVEEAIDHYDTAIGLQPDFAEARYNRALALLSLGDFARGWAEYEWRWKCPNFTPFTGPQPRWDGSPLGNRTLLVDAEQGFGDTLNFIRYIPLVRQRGGHVWVQVPDALMPLLNMSGYENLVAAGTPVPYFDMHAPLLSLPGIFGTTLETIPNQVPYLAAKPELVEQWHGQLASFEGFKIGIAWQGNPKYAYDRVRSIPLAAFEPLAKVPGVRLFSLQKGFGTEQIAAVAAQVPLVDLGPQLDRETGAFMDTAAVMKNLDLVVAPDAVMAHLAGGLGVPVWTALAFVGDWRWLRNRDDSPWYPTMRLFRQEIAGDWEGVFRRMAAVAAPLAAR